MNRNTTLLRLVLTALLAAAVSCAVLLCAGRTERPEPEVSADRLSAAEEATAEPEEPAGPEGSEEEEPQLPETAETGSDLTAEPAETGAPEEAPQPAAEDEAAAETGQEEAAEDAEAELTPAEQTALRNTQNAARVCTGSDMAMTDPDTWNEAGRAAMEALSAQYGFSLQAREGFPYLIAVNRDASTVTVYTADADGRYTVPYMAMVCSAAASTPCGYRTTKVSYPWRELFGPCWGQYAVSIFDNYLFHSVPYYTASKNDLEYEEYDLLGTPASMGCVRLAVCDEKWIYDNCPAGTGVIIYGDADDPGPMGKPGTIHVDPDNEKLRGWDPTDPDPDSPWGDFFETGTAIRSDAAWQEWDAAQADGRWTASVTPAG